MGSKFFFELPLYSAEKSTRDDVKSTKINFLTLSTAAALSSSMISIKGYNDLRDAPRVFPSIHDDEEEESADMLHTSSQLLENDLSIVSCTGEDLELLNFPSSVLKKPITKQSRISDTIFGDQSLYSIIIYILLSHLFEIQIFQCLKALKSVLQTFRLIVSQFCLLPLLHHLCEY